MNLCIIEDYSIDIDKINRVVYRLRAIAETRFDNVSVIRNSDVIITTDEYSNIKVVDTDILSKSDAILFWSKDLFLAHCLESMGYNVYNKSSAICAADSNIITGLLSKRGNILMPKSVVLPFTYNEHKLTDAYYNMVVDYLGLPIIVKEENGSFGMQVYKADSIDELKERLSALGNKNILLQECIYDSYGKDIRVNVVGNKVIGSMLRSNENDFRANITLGASAKPIKLNKEQERLAITIKNIFGLDFCGIDFLLKGDELVFCEINSNPNFLSFEEVTGIAYGAEVIDYIIKDVGNKNGK